MSDDLRESVTKAVRERLSSPVLGSFVIAWLSINYQFTTVALSFTEAYAKAIYLQSYLEQAGLLNLVIYPALVAFLLPILSALAFLFVERVNIWKINKIIRLKKLELIPLHEHHEKIDYHNDRYQALDKKHSLLRVGFENLEVEHASKLKELSESIEKADHFKALHDSKYAEVEADVNEKLNIATAKIDNEWKNIISFYLSDRVVKVTFKPAEIDFSGVSADEKGNYYGADIKTKDGNLEQLKIYLSEITPILNRHDDFSIFQAERKTVKIVEKQTNQGDLLSWAKTPPPTS